MPPPPPPPPPPQVAHTGETAKTVISSRVKKRAKGEAETLIVVTSEASSWARQERGLNRTISLLSGRGKALRTANLRGAAGSAGILPALSAKRKQPLAKNI